MRHALIRLAPCAVFASALASAQVVEKATTGSPTAGTPAVVTGGAAAPSTTLGGASATGLGLQSSLGAVAPAPTVGAAAAAAPAETVRAAGAAALPAQALPAQARTAIPAAAQPAAKAQPAAPSAGALIMPGGSAAAKPAAPGEKAAPTASSALDTAARGIEQGRKAEAAGGSGLSVRQALDRAYDTSTGAGDIAGGAAGVAGKFSSAREKVAGLVGVANNSAPADAPVLYASAVKAAQDSLPTAAAAAVKKAVLSFAMGKADLSLSELAQAAYSAATTGQTAEARRLVKSLDKWEELLGAPGRPLIANGDRLKAGVESELARAEKRSTPRVWVVKRGESYHAVLPGSSVEKVPGLAASFALKLEALSPAPLSAAYRAFAAKPGLRSAIAARAAMGESVPSAALSTGWLWLKHLLMRAWNGLASLLPGRRLPVTANESTLPRLREAARSWQEASSLGDAAARAASAPRLTVSRARGAFELARRAASAHEALTATSGAVARVDSLRAEFESGVKRAALSPADALNAGLESVVSGEGGLRHWASRYAADAREEGAAAFGRVRGASPVVVLGDGAGALAARSLAAASRDLSATAFGDALWASGSGPYGEVKVSADLRSTENGGSVALETERGDERLAASLDELGFSVARKGRGLRATLDAQSASADAREMAELAAEGAALAAGASVEAKPASPEGLSRLLADMKRSPKDAARTAASLDGTSRLSRARTVGWVGEYEAVSAELRSQGVRVIALRDPATGLSKFARIEPLRVK